MLTSAECRAQAEKKLAEADQDGRHRKRLITAAEGWLLLASRLRRVERALEAQGRPKRAKRAATGIRTALDRPAPDRGGRRLCPEARSAPALRQPIPGLSWAVAAVAAEPPAGVHLPLSVGAGRVALPLNGARLAPCVLEWFVFLRWRFRAPLPSTPARDADTHPLYSSQLARSVVPHLRTLLPADFQIQPLQYSNPATRGQPGPAPSPAMRTFRETRTEKSCRKRAILFQRRVRIVVATLRQLRKRSARRSTPSACWPARASWVGEAVTSTCVRECSGRYTYSCTAFPGPPPGMLPCNAFGRRGAA